jgi:hydroxyacylglutathione hydrolase
LLQRWKVPVFAPHDDRIADATHRVRDGATFELPHFGTAFEVMDIPGHTRSHIAFYGGGVLFCGDTLFAVGCGRLFEGTPQQMYDSLNRLAQLPDTTQVYCGHEYTLSNIRFAKAVEPANKDVVELEARARKQVEQGTPTIPTSMAQEKRTNPFLRVNEPEIIASANRRTGRTLTEPVGVLAAIREWKNSF